MKLGMVGLGRMGSKMVLRLLGAGHECVVFDVHAHATQEPGPADRVLPSDTHRTPYDGRENIASTGIVRRLPDHADRVRDYYGAWAATYGEASDNGLFARFRARERRVVSEQLALTGGESILDAGCGAGTHAKPLAALGHDVWAVDFCPQMVERVVGHVARAFAADVRTLELGRTFDRILCIGVLEFVTRPTTAFRQLREHLAPGGLLVVLVPRTTVAGRIYQLTKAWHRVSSQLFSPRELRAIAHDVGLRYVSHCHPFWHNMVMTFRRA